MAQAAKWNKPPFYRYKQIWRQLKIVDSALYYQYSPSRVHQEVTVPILPLDLHKDALSHNHDAPVAGLFGKEKTLEHLRCNAYWINMAKDVDAYCRQCSTYQQSKLYMPQHALLQNIPIGQPWQMIAVDILKVPLSTNNNRYLLVIQDFFTKWANAIPLPDQSASRITTELIIIKFFCTYGHHNLTLESRPQL